MWFGKKIEDGRKLVLTTVKQKDGEADKIFTFSVHRVALGVYNDDGVEMTSLALQPCETPQAVLDRRNDLSKIATVLADNAKQSISQVAQVVFQHRRHIRRVKDAVPLEWIEVATQFGVRHLRRVLEGERQYIECRHAAKGV